MRGAFFNTVFTYATQLLGFSAGVVLARLLDPEDYGLYGIGMALMLLFSRVRVWGFNSLILADPDPDDHEISTQFWLSIAFSLLVVVLLAAAGPLLRRIYSAPQVLMALVLAGLAVFESDGVASTLETMLARDLNYRAISGALLVASILGLAASIGMALAGWRAWALAGGYGVRTLAYCAGVWLLAPRRPRLLFSLARARGLLRRGRFLLWGGMGTFIAYQYDDIAVGTLAGDVALGLYRRAYDWSLLPMSIIGGILGVSGATYARVRDDRAALTAAVTSILDVVALIALPVSCSLALMAPEFVAVVYGEKWLPAVPLLRLLLVYSLFRPLVDSIGSLAQPLGLLHVKMRYGIAQSVAMIVLASLLTWRFGAAGAAVSAGLVVIIGFVIFYRDLLRPHVDVRYGAVFGAPLLVTAVASAATLLVFRAWAPPERWQLLLLKTALFFAVYGGLLLILARRRLLDRLRALRRVARAADPAPETP